MASEDIVTLEYPANVRKRPTMYLGTTEDTSICLREIIDNSIDELYRSKSANKISISFKNNIYTVADNGRGIPVKASKSNKSITMVRESLQNLHSGSKFNNSTASIGMNGVGSTAVSALSDYYEVYSKMSLQDINTIPKSLQESYKGESHYYCRFERGKFKCEGFKNLNSDYSTIVTYKPDMTIFESVEASLPTELKYIKYIVRTMYNKEVEFIVNGEPYDVGLQDLHTNIRLDGKNDENFYTMLLSVGMKDQYDPFEGDGSVNGLYCPNGLHIRWAHRAFTSAFNTLYGSTYSVEEVIYGLDMRVIMITGEPSFTGQIKECLAGIKGYPARGEAESNKLIDPILRILRKDKKYWDVHKKRIESLIDAKNKINTKQLVKDTLKVDEKKKKNLPSKLLDCSTRDRMKAELFITEGDSAGGSISKIRDPKVHAILKLRGKLLNTVGKSIDEILDNQEIRDIIMAIGIGTKDYCKPRNLRYGKIIIAADADADGFQIASLVLGLLYEHIPELFRLGVVYILQTPLFKVGDDFVYTNFLSGVNTKGKTVDRFKGLGSISASEMERIAISKDRKLMKVTMEDAIFARQLMTTADAKYELLKKRGVIQL